MGSAAWRRVPPNFLPVGTAKTVVPHFLGTDVPVTKAGIAFSSDIIMLGHLQSLFRAFWQSKAKR